MRRLSRQDVVQALGVLGVRPSGIVTADTFEAARQLAIDGFKRLLMENHPDRHSAAGAGERATARAQEISAAEHLLKATAWFDVAHIFAEPSGREREATSDWVADLMRRAWAEYPAGPGSGSRLYVRCPMCAAMVLAGSEHRCRIPVDHFRTKVRQSMRDREREARVSKCNHESPLGALCQDSSGHGGWHSGYTGRGKHSWTDGTEHVDVGGSSE